MLRAVLLIPLLAMVTCLCISIGSLGYLINQNTQQGNALSLLSSFAFPIILGAVTFGLKKLITKWLESPSNTQERKDDYTDLEQATLLP
jgi:formate/nitrite transporter FocA (FNT family)